MPITITGELEKRINFLAMNHFRSPGAQLELMVSVFEATDISRVSFLPGPAGAERIPVIEVYGQAIQGRGENE